MHFPNILGITATKGVTDQPFSASTAFLIFYWEALKYAMKLFTQLKNSYL